MKTQIQKKFIIGSIATIMAISSVLGGKFTYKANADGTPVVPYKIAENADLALRIAEEGTVLLKNNGILPLRPSDKVGGLGVAQDVAMVSCGGGSGWVNTVSVTDYKTGLIAAAQSGAISSYTPMAAPDKGEGLNKILYFISRTTTEGEDRTEDMYYLNAIEKKDLTDLFDLYGAERVAVVLNVGSVVDTTWLLDAGVGAIVLAYYGGERAGDALAAILTGAANPSGKTVDTWAKSYSDYPASHVGTFAGDLYTYYTEDVYVGYRYFETFDPKYEKVNYEFGFGLSYTKFEISERSVAIDGGNIVVSATVRNKGTRAGKEVIQAYYSMPDCAAGNPAKQLGGFAKTRLLAPGEYQTVKISFRIKDMAYFDDTGDIEANSWVLPKGEYKFFCGNSIKEASLFGALGTSYVSENDTVTEKCATELTPTMLPERLTADGGKQTLAGGDPAFGGVHEVPACGSVVIQAEEYTDKDKRSQLTNYKIGHTMGQAAGWLDSKGSYLEYTLDVKKAGKYKIAFSMSSAYNDQNDMFTVTVNGVPQNITVNMDATHSPEEFVTEWYQCILLDDGYELDLPQGEVKLRFSGNGMRFRNLDFFVIYNNDISPREDTEIYAALYDYSSTGRVQCPDGIVTGISGRSRNTYKYKVNVAEAGKYALQLSMSNNTVASANALGVAVNGVRQDVAVALPRTASKALLKDNNFKFVTTAPVIVDLTSGETELEFTTLDTAVCCIEKMIFTPSDGNEEKIAFIDNTDDFAEIDDTAGVTLEKKIMFDDVLRDFSTVDKFMSQMSIEELAHICALDTHSQFNEKNTNSGGSAGGIFGLNEKYGVPIALTADGSTGMHIHSTDDDPKYATMFPCITMLASAWNTRLAFEFGEGVAAEALWVGVNVWLAPAINIHRDPLCGRNFEYVSEDPFVAGAIGQYITNGAQSTGISVCLKHFAANNQETNRWNNSSCVSHRALREIYLKPFETVVRNAKPKSVMSSYNRINGVHVAGSKDILVGVLREEWGFEGAVFSDWDATLDHISMVKAQNTFKSGIIPDYDSLVAAYKTGVLTRAELEDNVKTALKFLAISNSVVKTQKYLADGERSLEWTGQNADYTFGSARLFRLCLASDGQYVLRCDGMTSASVVTVDGVSAEIHDGEIALTLERGQHDVIVDNVSDAETAKYEFFVVKQEYPSEPEDPPKKTTADSDVNVAAIAGGVVGGAAAIAAVSVAVVAAKKKHTKKDKKQNTGDEQE